MSIVMLIQSRVICHEFGMLIVMLIQSRVICHEFGMLIVILAESHVTLVSYVEKAEMTGGMSWHVEASKTGRLKKKRAPRENEFGIL